MLDQIYSFRNKNRFALSTPEYQPNMAIKKRKLSGCFNHKLAVLFSPWHGAGQWYDRLATRLEKEGWAVLVYEFSPEILKPDVKQVIKSFEFIQNAISSDLTTLVSEDSYTAVHMIGTSLGSLPLILAAENFRDFTEVTMVASSSNLAGATWEGLRTRRIRDELEAQGLTENDLDLAWANLAPKNHVKVFKNRRVNLVVSRTDRVIPAKFQMEYAKALKQAGADLKVTKTNLGHYASIVHFCLHGMIDN